MPTQDPPQPPQPPVVEGTEGNAEQQLEPQLQLSCSAEEELQPPVTTKKPLQPESSESTKLSTRELLAGAPVTERQAHNTRCASQSLDEDATLLRKS